MMVLARPISAAPLRLTWRLVGTNSVAFTLSPAINGGIYTLYARQRGPYGHWITFGSAVFGSNQKTLTFTNSLGGLDDLAQMTWKNLPNWIFVAGLYNDSDGDGLPDIYEDLATRTDPF